MVWKHFTGGAKYQGLTGVGGFFSSLLKQHRRKQQQIHVGNSSPTVNMIAFELVLRISETRVISVGPLLLAGT